jgi:hypothetical protein
VGAGGGGRKRKKNPKFKTTTKTEKWQGSYRKKRQKAREAGKERS